MTIEILKLDDLKPYEKNARNHPKSQVDLLAKNIERFGFTTPVLIDDNNEVIAGHGRLLAMKQLGKTEVPCVRMSGLSKKEVMALRLADNKIATMGDDDMDLVIAELKALEDEALVALTGFENDLLIEANEQDDVVPPVPEVAKSKLGEIYQLGNHRVMCGDSTDKASVERLMDGKKADMVFTDPPYGMKLDTDYTSLNSKLEFVKDKHLKSKTGNKYAKVIGDNDDFKPELITSVLDNFNYCKEIFLWGADYYAELLPNKNDGSWVVWDKRLEESADKMYGSCFELCWSKARHKRMLARVKWAGVFGTEQEFDRKRKHPTQKPVALVQWFFDYYSLKDKTNVVDLYGGSGGVLLTCEKNQKSCFMMELSPAYVDVIITRWELFTGQKAVLIQ